MPCFAVPPDRREQKGIKSIMAAQQPLYTLDSIFSIFDVRTPEPIRPCPVRHPGLHHAPGMGYGLDGPAAADVLAATVVIACAFSLTASWIVHGKDIISLKEVLTPKNIGKHALIVGLTFLIDAVIALLLFLLSPLLALLLTIPVIIYTFAIANVNSDSYILYLVDGKRSAEAEEPPAAQTPHGKSSGSRSVIIEG